MFPNPWDGNAWRDPAPRTRASSGRSLPLAVIDCMTIHATGPQADASSSRPRLTAVDVLDGAEVARLLHLPVSTVLDFARRGVLPGRKLGRRWIFLRDELEYAVRAAPTAQDARAENADTAPNLQKTTLKRYRKAVPSAEIARSGRPPARP
jgi:excisionase family DNA binding protein